MNLGEHYKSVAKDRISKFGFPSWMAAICPTCKTELEVEHVIEAGVSFAPQFLGDLSLSYLCPQCSTMFVWHIKCNIKNVNDIVIVFSRDYLMFETQYEHILMRDLRHNIAEEEVKKEKRS